MTYVHTQDNSLCDNHRSKYFLQTWQTGIFSLPWLPHICSHVGMFLSALLMSVAIPARTKSDLYLLHMHKISWQEIFIILSNHVWVTSFPLQAAFLQSFPFGLFKAVHTPFAPPVNLCDMYIMSSYWASSFHIASPNPWAKKISAVGLTALLCLLSVIWQCSATSFYDCLYYNWRTFLSQQWEYNLPEQKA